MISGKGRVAPNQWPHLGEGVAKQKCGTCRFFQEAGLAGSGWCHHPQRKTPGVMIMVRRNELACRDEWSQSLWQSHADPSTNDEPMFQRPPHTAALPPTSAESLRSLLGTQEPSAMAPAGEDVLLSEARIVSEPEPPWEPPARPLATGNFDPRTAIFKAREAYRDRARANAAAARQLAGAEAISDSQSGAVEATRLGEMDREAMTEGETPREAEQFSSATSTATTASSSLEFSEVTPASTLLARTDVEVPAYARGVTPARSVSVGADIARDLPRTQADVGPGVADTDANGWLIAPHATQPPATEAESEPDEALPAWFRTDLPRICRACRDFRPSGEGQRGWCANAWAFTHRRLVQADDMAPCHSAIGDWWVPVDAVWLVAADVSAHGRATPLLDRLIAEERAQRRRS
jgi:hypothetical protein